jgi:hypothetical protein
MGYTNYEIEKIKPFLENGFAVLDFGSQNLYTTSAKNPPFVSEWYKDNGIDDYTCFDLAGDNNAHKINWSYTIDFHKKFDILVDAGSGEHSAQKEEYISLEFHEGYINSIYPKGQPTKEEIELGFYNCWLNKHNLLKIGGLMVNINPLTSNWENHGYSYLGENFYHELIKIAGYKLIETEVVCAMGNCESGKNVVGVLKKVSEQFPEFKEFYKNLPIYKL